MLYKLSTSVLVSQVIVVVASNTVPYDVSFAYPALDDIIGSVGASKSRFTIFFCTIVSFPTVSFPFAYTVTVPSAFFQLFAKTVYDDTANVVVQFVHVF